MRARILSSLNFFAIVAFSCFAVAGQSNTTNGRTLGSEKLSPAEVADWRADLNYVAKEFPAKHANLFHRLEKEKFSKAVKTLDARIPELSRHQVALEMGRIVGMARDGHSYIATIWDPRRVAR